jgi:hypothetical protein
MLQNVMLNASHTKFLTGPPCQKTSRVTRRLVAWPSSRSGVFAAALSMIFCQPIAHTSLKPSLMRLEVTPRTLEVTSVTLPPVATTGTTAFFLSSVMIPL